MNAPSALVFAPAALLPTSPTVAASVPDAEAGAGAASCTGVVVRDPLTGWRAPEIPRLSRRRGGFPDGAEG